MLRQLFPSPFKEAIIMTLDGVGEWATTTVAIGSENKIKMLKEIRFPQSLDYFIRHLLIT